MSSNFPSLSNQFLVAMPEMDDPLFAGAVVYLCEHNEKGALGIVINKPTDILVNDLFQRLELPLQQVELGNNPVVFGGPVHTERGFILHDGKADYDSSLRIHPDLELTTSRDVLEHIAEGKGPNKVLISLGYAGWSAGQLEAELSKNSWLNVLAQTSIIFDTPIEQRFRAAMQLLGIDPVQLSRGAGHA